jgi:hypothetical protein
MTAAAITPHGAVHLANRLSRGCATATTALSTIVAN